MGGHVFFSQNHARKEDFSWEFSDCKRCKFLCRKMRISWKTMKFGPVDVFFLGGGGGGEKIYHLSRNSGRRFTLVVPSDTPSFVYLFWCYSGAPLASSINMWIHSVHEYQHGLHGQASQDASEKDASWFTSFLLK